MHQKSIKIAFQAHFGGTHFCVWTFENLKLLPPSSKSTFHRLDAHFFLKRATIGQIMHKNAMKYENIMSRGVFSAEGAEIFFRPIKH